MSRVLDPQVDRNRTSMSRALGAAFLNHQVAELERNNQRTKAPRGRGGRARRSDRDREDYDPDFDRARTKATFGIDTTPVDQDSWRRRPQSSDDTASESASPTRPRIPLGHHRSTPLADVIVVDASVLIYALGAVQRWCNDGQTQVVIPLEALNTLDVLKSGTNQTAVRSRAASRVLEEQVGNNPRIRVQREDAFVPWDSIAAKSATGATSTPNPPDTRWKVEGAGAPEWMKRMVCCAKWEAGTGNPDGKRVIFAVVDAKDAAASGRYDNLVDGELVTQWSAKLGLEVVKVDKEKPAGSPTKGERRTRGGGGGAGRSSGGPPAGRNRGRGTLVEKPAPVITAPPAGKVIRVLARGEKLEPE
ncbi:PIN domain protein [Rhizoctonia solani 123E]|uniref:PIN domain protein n=1 Tax=Rhizoctonia solani 123E TaxID=1423351 RepID=A0A074RUV0_9AGAM|nr:PIN domain protein [Rhizoctonia solani 123E]